MAVAHRRFRERHISYEEVTINQSIADGSVRIPMQYPNPLVDVMLAFKVTFLAFMSHRLGNIILPQNSVYVRRKVLLRLTKFVLSKYCGVACR